MEHGTPILPKKRGKKGMFFSSPTNAGGGGRDSVGENS